MWPSGRSWLAGSIRTQSTATAQACEKPGSIPGIPAVTPIKSKSDLSLSLSNVFRIWLDSVSSFSKLAFMQVMQVRPAPAAPQA